VTFRKTGDADGETSGTLGTDETDQALRMREPFGMGGESRLALGRVAAQGQDTGEAGAVVLLDDRGEFRAGMADAGEMSDQRDAHLHELRAVGDRRVARSAARAVGQGGEIDPERLQGRRDLEHARAAFRVLGREELHRNRGAHGTAESGDELRARHPKYLLIQIRRCMSRTAIIPPALPRPR
jgi:hypothetical protein